MSLSERRQQFEAASKADPLVTKLTKPYYVFRPRPPCALMAERSRNGAFPQQIAFGARKAG